METNYNEYKFNKKEIISGALIAVTVLMILGKLFYDNLFVGLFFSPLIYFAYEKRKNSLIQKRKKKLQNEFREALLSVSAGMVAGYSVENAFGFAYRDIVLLFGEESDMARELSLIIKKLKTNQPIEEIIANLGIRSDVEDILDFSYVFQIAKRNGGDLCKAIESTAGIIREKGEVEQDIETMLAGKKLERNVMLLIPFFMIGFLSLTSRGYFAPLYHNLKGIFISTVCLGMYAAACFLMDKMTRIEI